MPFLYVIAALILLVVLHELGHFLAARAVGIRATKFYVFFPPALFKRTVGGVEYGVGAIPAGGFVKLPGMFEPVPGEVAERLRGEFAEVLPLVRDGDLRLQLDAARRAVAHADAPDDLLAPLAEIREGLERATAGEHLEQAERDLLERTRDRVTGLLDDAHPKAYWRASLWRRMTVIFAGPLVNLLIAFVVLTIFHWLLTPTFELRGPLRVQVADDSPAQRAGLDDESRIIEWNGAVEGISPRQLGERIESGRGKPVEIRWRDGDGDVRDATIRPERLDGQGSQPLIGVSAIEPTKVERTGRDVTSLATGATRAIDQMRFITVENLRRLPQVFFNADVREDVGSVVGIVQFADEVDEAGQIIGYIAIISLILAVMNLLPLLPLDGGHLLFGALEALRRGRPMPRAAFERYSLLGIAIVLMLFFIGLDNDITRART